MRISRPALLTPSQRIRYVLQKHDLYTVVGSILWAIAARMVAGLVINVSVSPLVPPMLFFGYALYEGRGRLL